MIRVHHLKDILREPRAEELALMDWRPDLRVRDCAPVGFNLDGGHAVIQNHRALAAADLERFVADGDDLVFGEVPGVEVSLGGFLLFVALTGLSIGLSYAIAALTAPNARIRQGGPEDGPSRNWEGIQDTAGSGRPIPTVYGKIRAGGQFLQSFERAVTGQQVVDGTTTLHTLLGLAMGPVKSISDVEINGNKLSKLADVTLEVRRGLSDQAPIDGFNDIVQETIHQRAITRADGWVAFTTRRPVEAIEVTFRFPQGLLRVSKGGNPLQHDVVFSYEIREHGTGNIAVIRSGAKTVSANTRNPFKAQVKEEGLPLSYYDIRIRRETLDDKDQEKSLTYQSTSEVYAISDVTYEPQAHPGIALLALKQIPSAQLNGQVPTTYTALVEGFEDIRIYTDESNYTTGFTDIPAWCCAHFLTSRLHGLGDKYDWSNIDLPAFLLWAASTERLVSDGKGGLERRATFNHVFDSIAPTDEQIQVFAQGSGAFLLKRGARWTVVLDEAESMIWIANEGNISPGTLRYSFLPARQLANRITVAFANQEENYRRDTYTEEIPDLAPLTPYVDADRSLWGVTRPSQAAREVRRMLLHNKLDRAQVELESSLDSLRLFAGAIFGVAVRQAAIGIANGRILEVDSSLTRIRIDEEVTLEPGKTYEIVVQHATDQISTKRILNSGAAVDQIFLQDAAWAGALAAGDVYSIGEVSSAVEKFRCVECSLRADWTRKIRGLRYDPAAYTDDLAALPTTIKSGIPDPRLLPPDVEDLNLLARLDQNPDGALVNVVEAHWTAPISAILDYYEVWSRTSGAGEFEFEGITRSHTFTIRGVLAGFVYEVSVVGVSANGVRKAADAGVRGSVAVTAITTQPPDLANLRAVITDGTLILTVDPLTDLDLGATGYYEFRRGSTWNQSVLLGTSRAPRLEVTSYARGVTSVLAKAVNSLGNKSAAAAAVSITLYGQVEENIVVTQDDFPSWPGTRTGFVVEGGTNKLSLLQPAATWLLPKRRRRGRRSPRSAGFGVPPATTITLPAGTYTTLAIEPSPGNVIRARPDVLVDFDAIYIGLGTFDGATFAFDDPKAQIPFSGEESDKVSVLVDSRWSTTTTDEGAFTPWSEHRDRGEISFRHIQFRLRVTTSSSAYSAEVGGFKISIDLPDKVTSGKYTQGSASAFTVNYPASFFVAVKRLLVTLFAGANGDYVKVTAETAASFTAEIRNSADTLTTGTIHYEARGY